MMNMTVSKCIIIAPQDTVKLNSIVLGLIGDKSREDTPMSKMKEINI